jgi:hypothetical protein
MLHLIISLLIGLILVGFVLWLMKLLPIDATVKQIIVGVVILIVVLVVLNAVLVVFGHGDLGYILGPGGNPRR